MIKYSDCIAIANWSSVPYQTFNTSITLGVVAFHISDSGISNVQFSVNNGPLVTIKSPTPNVTYKISEYLLILNAKDYKDGPIIIDAIVNPVIGLPKKLDTVTLYSNFNNTLPVSSVYVSISGKDTNLGTLTSPVLTIDKAQHISSDGGNIYLLDNAEYEISASGLNLTNQRWITIQPYKFTKVTDIKIIAKPGSGRIILRSNRTKIRQITIDMCNGFLYCPSAIWIDSCETTFSKGWNPVPANDPGVPFRTNNAVNEVFITDTNALNTIYGFPNCKLVKGCGITHITGDAFQCSSTVLSNHLMGFYGTSVHHADVYQMWGGMDNVIVDNLITVNTEGVQGLFLQPTYPGGAQTFSMTNSAFNNITFTANDPGGSGTAPFSQLQSSFKNVLFRNWDTKNQQVIIRSDITTGLGKFDAENVLFEHCTFHHKQNWHTPSGVVFQNCISGVSTQANWTGYKTWPGYSA